MDSSSFLESMERLLRAATDRQKQETEELVKKLLSQQTQSPPPSARPPLSPSYRQHLATARPSLLGALMMAFLVLISSYLRLSLGSAPLAVPGNCSCSCDSQSGNSSSDTAAAAVTASLADSETVEIYADPEGLGGYMEMTIPHVSDTTSSSRGSHENPTSSVKGTADAASSRRGGVSPVPSPPPQGVERRPRPTESSEHPPAQEYIGERSPMPASCAPRRLLKRGLLTKRECEGLISFAAKYQEAETYIPSLSGASLWPMVRDKDINVRGAALLNATRTKVLRTIRAHFQMPPELPLHVHLTHLTRRGPTAAHLNASSPEYDPGRSPTASTRMPAATSRARASAWTMGSSTAAPSAPILQSSSCPMGTGPTLGGGSSSSRACAPGWAM